jgi:hypothetical protein
MSGALRLRFAYTLVCASILPLLSAETSARPVEYVKICSLYGDGFFYLPGTDTCIKIGGRIRGDSYRVNVRPVVNGTRPPEPWQEGVCNNLGRGFHWNPDRPDTCLRLDSIRGGSAVATIRPYAQLTQYNGPGNGYLGGWQLQASVFFGTVNASSFGSNYNTQIIGGRVAAGIRPADGFRLQFDVQGETTASYCPACGDRSYLAGGVHYDISVNGLDVGLFGGFETINPTFAAPTSDYSFVGIEGRYRLNGAVVTGQFGYLDTIRGPGTLTGAWFGELRARYLIDGAPLGIPGVQNLSVGFGVGYASGKLGVTGLDATSTYWKAGLGARWPGTPVTSFVGYFGFSNWVQGRGTVWDEHIVKGGVKIDLGAPAVNGDAEPMWPLPMVTRTIPTF